MKRFSPRCSNVTLVISLKWQFFSKILALPLPFSDKSKIFPWTSWLPVTCSSGTKISASIFSLKSLVNPLTFLIMAFSRPLMCISLNLKLSCTGESWRDFEISTLLRVNLEMSGIPNSGLPWGNSFKMWLIVSTMHLSLFLEGHFCISGAASNERKQI